MYFIIYLNYNNIVNYLIILSGFSFILYGLTILSTDHMKLEFERYQLSQFRVLTGLLELLGGIGCLIGFLYPSILFLASGGLSLLMFLGLFVRLKVGDPFYQTIPAFILMLINLKISYSSYFDI